MCHLCHNTKWIKARVEAIEFESPDPWGITTNEISGTSWMSGHVPCPACVPHSGVITKIEFERPGYSHRNADQK